MQPAEPRPGGFANPLVRWLAATRPAFLAVTLVGCLIGIASAHAGGVAIDPLRAALTVLFALLAHAGGNVVNDYHDALSGADDANRGRLFPFTGGSRFIQNGVHTLRQTALLGYGLLAAVVLGGVWLAWQAGPGLLVIGLAGLALGWAYSAPPLKLVCRGFGELVIVACWLLVVVGADFVQRGAFDLLPVAAGLSYALLVANLLFINQFPDHDGDAASGKRTLVVRLGPQVAKWGYLLIAIAAYAWLVAMVANELLPQKSAAAALTVALSFPAGRDLLEHASDPSELATAIKRTIVAALAHGSVLAGVLAFA
ncbi:prenyltransferase [Thauera sp. WH-1]|uniref:prenyltransferase n=1 Tax=Thauera sp. WH-1 TaxID=3398230 RepID=UPI0039FDCDB0